MFDRQKIEEIKRQANRVPGRGLKKRVCVTKLRRLPTAKTISGESLNIRAESSMLQVTFDVHPLVV